MTTQQEAAPAPTAPTWLARLTRRRWAWVGIVIWALIIAVSAPAGNKLANVEKNQAVNYLPNNAQSTKAYQALLDFPSAAAAPTIAVWVADAGTLSAADKAAIVSQRDQIVRDVRVSGTVSPVTYSADGRAAAVQVPLPSPISTRTLSQKQSNTILKDAYNQLREVVQPTATLRSGITGGGAYDVESINAFNGIDGILILAAGLVVAVLLLIIYRSPVLWLIPLITSGLALELAQGVVHLLAGHAGLTVTGLSAGILDVLVFGAGTDYALLLVARYREELHHYADARVALAVALRQAAPAMLASASTVILSLLCLLAATLNSDRGLGPVAAVGVACAIVAALTLLPALLAVCGRRIFWPFVPRVEDHVDHEGAWSRLATKVERRRRPAWVGLVIVLGIGAACLSFTRLGLPGNASYTNDPPPVKGQTLLDAHFPAGTGDPADIVTLSASADAVQRVVAATPGVSSVVNAEHLGDLTHLEAVLAATPDSNAANAIVVDLRHRLAQIPEAHALVGGDTAINFDTDNAANHDRDLIIPLILVVVLVILSALLRAILAPVLLVATVILSFAAALGISVVIFRWVFHFAGVDQTVPLYAFLFLVALGVDYNIFLMTRIREESAKGSTRLAVHIGVARTGGVITSAGLILSATFAVLGVLPLVVLAEVGFTVAFGILLDTFLVRSILVPALCFDLGSRVWWPSSLVRASAAD